MNADSSKGAGGVGPDHGHTSAGCAVRPTSESSMSQADGPPRSPVSEMTVAIWIHDGPVCVTVMDPPPSHAASGICRCPACLAHDPDRALDFY